MNAILVLTAALEDIKRLDRPYAAPKRPQTAAKEAIVTVSMCLGFVYKELHDQFQSNFQSLLTCSGIGAHCIMTFLHVCSYIGLLLAFIFVTLSLGR